MKTTILPFEAPTAIPTAIEVLNTGGLIAFPTDTVYGIAADLWNPAAIDKIFTVKERTKDKPLPILIGTQEHIQLVAAFEQINQQTLMLMGRFWPGAMTIIVPKHDSIPENLSPFETAGIRMPDHSRLLKLLTATGPLAVTSANKSGKDNPTTAEEVFAQLGGEIELILDGGKTQFATPSTVIQSNSDGFTILRQGAVTAEEINELFQ